MSCNKADAFITLAVDVMASKTLVTGYLRLHADPEIQVPSFSCLLDDAGLLKRLPEWLAELRAECVLGRVETLAEQQARLAAQALGAMTVGGSV